MYINVLNNYYNWLTREVGIFRHLDVFELTDSNHEIEPKLLFTICWNNVAI